MYFYKLDKVAVITVPYRMMINTNEAKWYYLFTHEPLSFHNKLTNGENIKWVSRADLTPPKHEPSKPTLRMPWHDDNWHPSGGGCHYLQFRWPLNGRLNSKLKFWFFFFNTYSINMDSCKSCHYNFKIICCLIYPEYIILISLCNNFEIKFVRVFSIIFLNSIFVLLFIAFSLYYYHDSWDTFHIFQLPE